MQIKTNAQEQKKKVKTISPAGIRRFLLLFLAYNIILGCLGVFLFYSEIHFSRRERLIEQFVAKTGVKQMLKKARFRMEGSSGNTTQLALTISPEDEQKLNDLQNLQGQPGAFAAMGNKPIPASVEREGRSYPVDLYVRKNWASGVENASQVGLNVRTRGEDRLFGMNNFSLLPSEAGILIDKWLNHKLFAYAGLISPYFDFVYLDINGRGNAIYGMEERVGTTFGNQTLQEGPVVLFHGEPFWSTLQGHSEAESNASFIAHPGTGPPTADPESFKKALALMAGFQEKRLQVQQVFDLNKLAAYFALTDLLGGTHHTGFDQLKFYYNTESGLLEPVNNGNQQPEYLGKQGLTGAEYQIRTADQGGSRTDKWYDRVFSDRSFYQAYVGHLEKLAAPDFLAGFIGKHEKELFEKLRLLSQGDSPGTTALLQSIHENLEYIRFVLMPAKVAHAYFEGAETDRRIKLKVTNIHNLPIEILGADIGDTLLLSLPERAALVQANIQLTPAVPITLEFDMPGNYTWADSLLTELTIRARILGGERMIDDEAIPYSMINPEYLENDLIRMKPNAANFDFIEIDDQNKVIWIRPGNHTLSNDLVLPPGYTVRAGAGTRIDMIKDANILSHSPLKFEGTEEQPVSFFSSDSTAQGITIMYAESESLLKYVHFDNLSRPDVSGWSLTSAITFYESPVRIEYALFEHNRIGDDYLNIVRTDFVMDRTTFSNSNADAFDCDFCEGIVKNTRFINSGNDAIDISGTIMMVENVFMDYVGDKGISVGENSQMTAKDIAIQNAEIAVTSKDLSKLSIENIQVKDCRIAFTAFQKKSEFGPATIEIPTASTISGKIEIPYLIEDGSTLTIGGEVIRSSVDIDHVKQILYGIKFGKSSS